MGAAVAAGSLERGFGPRHLASRTEASAAARSLRSITGEVEGNDYSVVHIYTEHFQQAEKV